MSARWLKLIAPFRCQFNLDSATFIEKGKAFKAYLRELNADINTTKRDLFVDASHDMIIKSAKMIEKSEEFNGFLRTLNVDFRADQNRLFPGVPEGVVIEAKLESQDEEASSRYISLDKAGSLFNFPEYLSISFGEKLHQGIDVILQEATRKADTVCGKTLSAMLTPDRKSIDIAVYDNTIAILTIDIAMADELDSESWSVLDEWTTRFVLFFLSRLYKSYIFPALNGVNTYAANRNEKRVQNPDKYDLFYDMSGQEADPSNLRLMWVNRTLICPKGEASSDWARRNMDNSTAIAVGNATFHPGIGKNVLETSDGNQPHELAGVWQAIYLGHYFHAVLDVTSKNLKRFIGSPHGKKSNQQLREWNRTMHAVIDRVTNILLEYKDLPFELQGIPKEVFRTSERKWELDALLINIQGKCELAKSHVQLLHEHTTERNRLRSQLALVGGLGVGYVGLMTGMSSVVNALNRESSSVETSGFLDIARMLSPNVMTWLGVVVAVLVSVFLYTNRTR